MKLRSLLKSMAVSLRYQETVGSGTPLAMHFISTVSSLFTYIVSSMLKVSTKTGYSIWLTVRLSFLSCVAPSLPLTRHT